MPNHGLAFAHVIARSSATCGAGVDLVSAVLFTGVSSSCKVGNLKLFNFPCVVEDAPYRGYGGHASHVMNAKFLGFDSLVATVGGADRSVLLWKVEVPVGTSRPRKYVEALH